MAVWASPGGSWSAQIYCRAARLWGMMSIIMRIGSIFLHHCLTPPLTKHALFPTTTSTSSTIRSSFQFN